MKKIYYKWTLNYDESKPNNNFHEEIENEEVADDYTFEERLREAALDPIEIEIEKGVYFIVDEIGERTGEAYLPISERKIYCVTITNIKTTDEWEEDFYTLEEAKEAANTAIYRKNRDNKKWERIEIRDYEDGTRSNYNIIQY